MDVRDFENIQPFVRMVKIKKSVHLEGAWEDLDHVLIYIAQGMLDYVASGSRYHLQAGDFILMSPYVHHLAIKANNKPLVQYIVHFDFYSDPERVKILHQSAMQLDAKLEIPEREMLLNDEVYVSAIPREDRFVFEQLFLTMYREFSQNEDGYTPLMLKGLATQLIATLMRRLSEDARHSDTLAKKTKSWKLVESALEYIYLHYNENPSNEAISEAVNASPNYLSKLFRQYIGVSLHTYVLNYRLERARKLLLSGACNITEAALRSGFSSVHTFSKAFKKVRGVSPSTYVEGAEGAEVADAMDKLDYDLDSQIFYNQ